MNILYTESSPNIGGQELQAVAQMCAMRRLGHTVMLACREQKLTVSTAKHIVLGCGFIRRMHMLSLYT